MKIPELSRRERQILDALYRLGEATVADVVAEMPDDPDYHAIRMALGVLEKKGIATHHSEGNRYVYRPTVPREKAGRAAVTHVTKTFFDGSPSRAVLSLLDSNSAKLSAAELDEIAEWIEQARRKKPT